MTLITLKEHESFPPRRRTADQELLKKIKELEHVQLEEQDQKLKNALQNDVLTISRDSVEDRLRFKAHSCIGLAQFSNFAVAITPKFSEIGKLVELIDYVYTLDLEIFEESETRFAGERGLISEIIISAFVKKCQRLVRQGLAKSYELREDDLPFLRGKLIIPRQIINRAKTRLQFACEYDEFEHNNLENQIILFCLKRIYYVTINVEQKKEIRRLIQNFSDLVDFKEVSYDDFNRINYNQMNSHYKKIHELCKLIVSSTQITDFYEQKLRFVNSFFVDMNVVFEKFVSKLFDEHYPLPAREQFRYDSWKSGRDGKSISSIIDILIFEKDKKTIHAIVDTKYKTDLSDADRYQLEHYIHDYEKTEAYAILPKFGTGVPDIYTATKQGICIKTKHVDIDRMLNLLNNKDHKAKNQIKESLLEMIPV